MEIYESPDKEFTIIILRLVSYKRTQTIKYNQEDNYSRVEFIMRCKDGSLYVSQLMQYTKLTE